MQQFNQENSKNKKNKLMNFDDDSMLMDFDFKPLTDGLGFKSKRLEETRILVPKAAANLFQPPKPEMTRHDQMVKTDLDIFYKKPIEQEISLTETELAAINMEATFGQRFLAMTMDLGFLVSIVFLTLFCIQITSGFPLMEGIKTFNSDVWLSTLVIFSFYYIGYFSIAEKYLTSTVGKEMLGIKVEQNKNLSLQIYFIRSLISYFAFFTFGIIGYYDLQSKITDTKIVRI